MTVICDMCSKLIDPDEPMKLIGNSKWAHVDCYKPDKGPEIE